MAHQFIYDRKLLLTIYNYYWQTLTEMNK